MAYRLEFEQWVPFPLDQVFRFFANPGNLPPIMPPALGAQIQHMELVPPPDAPPDAKTGPVAGTGSVAVISVRMIPLLPFRAQWVARIVEFAWNHHFVDIQEKGPFRSWRHQHWFVAETRGGVEGTVVGDLVEYEIGFGVLGKLAQNIFVAGEMRRTFAHRQRVLESLLAQSRD